MTAALISALEKASEPKKLFCERGQHRVARLTNHGGEVGELTACALCEAASQSRRPA